MSSWDVSMSNHAGLVFNPIRTVSDNAKPSPSPKPIIKLSVGDPTLDKNLLHVGSPNQEAEGGDRLTGVQRLLPYGGLPRSPRSCRDMVAQLVCPQGRAEEHDREG
ncbi:hypothetical protein TcBrA4_0002870 [Trypanosoma cruzi]|nr:hypothetical protein TcBrA4_0002870 [Trypanosoma cruzi]